jgi:hypothetical protein
MSNLLKEAIADAKAVKKVAIENAKLALEETFQREVTGMFQEKIKEELAKADEMADETTEGGTIGVGTQKGGILPKGGSGIGSGKPSTGDNKKPKGGVPKGTKTSTKDVGQKFGATMNEDAEEQDEAGAHVDSKTFHKPFPEEEGVSREEDMEEAMEEEGTEEITNDELEEILSSLEEEMAQNPNAPVPAPVDPNAPVAQQLPAPVDPNAPVAQQVPQPQQVPAPQPPVAEEGMEEEGVEEEGMEEINLEEILSEIEADEDSEEEEGLEEAKKKQGEEEEEEEEEEESKKSEEALKKEVTSLRKSLAEHVKVVEFLREQINEINLLNAKLLYTNKLFKQFSLSNQQKLSIVEKFDLASNMREVKMAYTILAESMNSGASVVSPKKTNTTVKNLTEGLASKAVASTKPSKDVIVENTNEMALRFQRLAGIKK